MRGLIKSLFRALGLNVARRDRLAELIPSDYVQSPYLPRVYRQSVARLLYFKEMLEMIRAVDGDVVECGVSTGHGILYFLLLGELIGVERKVVGFDSFEGFPASVELDRKTDGTFQIRPGDYATPQELVAQVLRDGRISPHLRENNVCLIQGFFDRTLDQYQGRIALLHLDCDLYDSYWVCLKRLYDKVVPGGLILFDDYDNDHFPGAARAVNEFFADKREAVQKFDRYDYGKYYVVKS